MSNRLRLLGVLVGILSGAAVLADDDHEHSEHNEHSERSDDGASRGGGVRYRGVAPLTDSLVQSECGSCHFPYPAGLLPARSWTVLMNGLDSHFGDVAILEGEEKQRVLDYLTTNAADRSTEYALSAQISRAVGATTVPLRITEVPFIRHEHAELPRGVVGPEGAVRSFSMCSSCHTGAARGSFSESEIRVPGLGRWGD